MNRRRPAEVATCRNCQHPDRDHGGDDGSPDCYAPTGPANVTWSRGIRTSIAPGCSCTGFTPALTVVPA